MGNMRTGNTAVELLTFKATGERLADETPRHPHPVVCRNHTEILK